MLQHLAIANVKPKGNFYNQTFKKHETRLYEQFAKTFLLDESTLLMRGDREE